MMKLLTTSIALLTALAATGCGQAATAGVAPATAKVRAASAPAQAAAVPAEAGARGFDQTTGATTGAAAVPSAAGVSLNVLTYNTWGKPGLLGTDEKDRFARLGPAIQGFDVVTLQETFTRHTKSMVKVAGFPHVKRSENGDLFHLNAGLTTLSRFAIVKTDFAKFKEAGDFDRFANKGVLFTRLDVPGVGEVDLYTTHYQARQEAKFGKIRLHDNAVLEALVKKHAKGNPTVLTGDFNMLPDSPEYQDLMTRLKPRDAFAEANPGAPGYTSGPPNPYKETDSTPKRIDYVFLLGGDRHDIRIDSCAVTMDQPVGPNGGKVLSDHYGVQARLTFLPRP